MACNYCGKTNVVNTSANHRKGERGPAIYDINSRTGLAALHTGIGHSQYAALTSILGIPSLSSSNFKNRERESGIAVEAVAKESCQAFTEKEKLISQTCSSQEKEYVKVGVSYDMGWRKRGRRYDSSSGVGTAVGLKTGKVISYSTRNTMCRVCKLAEKNQRTPEAHDCRKNHNGSSKSMESNVAVQLFSEATQNGVSYSIYVGDDDSTTESHLQTLVNYDIEKWSDINHTSRTLGSRLYAAKNKVEGLTSTVIAYIQKCFTYCIKQNKNDPTSLLDVLSSIVPHAFGQHKRYKKYVFLATVL